MRRQRALAILTFGLALVGACAKQAPLATTPGAPRYPEFLFPAPEDTASLSRTAEQHRAWDALQAGDLGSAEREFNQLLRRAPGSPSLLADLGYVALARRDFDRAVSRFTEAISADPGLAPALVGRGLGYAEMGRPLEAMASFEAAQQADPLLQLTSRIEALRFRAVEDAIGKARFAAAAGNLEQARRAYGEALDASPDSALLLRELAAVERRAGHPDQARLHLERAAEVDPADRLTRVQLADLAEAQGDLAGATRAYEAAQAIDRTSDVEARLSALEERLELAALPAEYRAIPLAPGVTRADMAALVGVRLPRVLRAAPDRPVPLVTDVGKMWASPWIEAVLRAGVMEPFPNHTFQPQAHLRRADLAIVVSRLLSLVAALDPARAGHWQHERATFTDLPPSHPAYDAASRAVGARMLAPDSGGAFVPMRPVTGAEAADAIARLERLVGPAGRSERR
jgi:tetratricopeptide (TPR) repeat protein